MWALSRLFENDKGGVAVTFALIVAPLAFLSVVLLDYSRASGVKQELQESLDAATLIAARSTAITANDIDAIGDKALAAQLSANGGIDGLKLDATGRMAGASFTLNGPTVQGAVNLNYTPLVSGLFTGGPIKISVTSDVMRSLTKLEIALVLDTTGSMDQNGKIDSLKVAASNFIDTMQSAAARSTETSPVKIAIVPFSTTVRVSAPLSMASYNTSTFSMTGLPTWLDGRARAFDWDDDIFTTASSATSDRIDRFKMLKQMGTSWGGCVEARKAPYDIQDTAPSTGAVATLFTPFFAPDEPDVSTSDYRDSVYTKVSWGYSYNDYLTDGYSSSTSSSTLTSWRVAQGRVAKYNTTSFRKTGSNPVGSTYGPNSGCDMKQMQRLSTNFAALKSAVNGLNAAGETNIPLGLMWGWHALSPNTPFSDGSAYGTTGVTKVIVLMTDGDNTMTTNYSDNNSYYHGYGYIWQGKLGTTSGWTTTRTTKMDERMSALCANIKAKNIIIYTVGVGVSASSKSLLQSCATATDAYYDVDASAGNLDAAFSAIAGSIENVRISR